jgi:hypothetical protein
MLYYRLQFVSIHFLALFTQPCEYEFNTDAASLVMSKLELHSGNIYQLLDRFEFCKRAFANALANVKHRCIFEEPFGCVRTESSRRIVFETADQIRNQGVVPS